MAGYADYRRLLMQGYTPEEISVILGKPGGTTKVNEGNKRVPGAVYGMNSPASPTKAEMEARKPSKKLIQARLPGMDEADSRNYDPGIAELQASPYSTPYTPGEFVGAMPADATAQALRGGQEAVARATGAPPIPYPEQAQRVAQAARMDPGSQPIGNWQGSPSVSSYMSSRFGEPQFGRMPGTSQGMPEVTKQIMEQAPKQQLSQQSDMMSAMFANADNDAQKMDAMNQQNMLSKLMGNQNQGLLGGSFLGKLFGGLF